MKYFLLAFGYLARDAAIAIITLGFAAFLAMIVIEALKWLAM